MARLERLPAPSPTGAAREEGCTPEREATPAGRNGGRRVQWGLSSVTRWLPPRGCWQPNASVRRRSHVPHATDWSLCRRPFTRHRGNGLRAATTGGQERDELVRRRHSGCHLGHGGAAAAMRAMTIPGRSPHPQRCAKEHSCLHKLFHTGSYNSS